MRIAPVLDRLVEVRRVILVQREVRPAPTPEPSHDELPEPALRPPQLSWLLGDLEVAAVGVQRQSVWVARVDDEGDAGREEGGERLDVGDGGLVRAHLLDSGREKHTVHDGDVDAPFSNAVSCTASTPGPGTETENTHNTSRITTALRTEPGIALEGWGIRVGHLEGVDDVFLEFRNVLLSERAHREVRGFRDSGQRGTMGDRAVERGCSRGPP